MCELHEIPRACVLLHVVVRRRRSVFVFIMTREILLMMPLPPTPTADALFRSYDCVFVCDLEIASDPECEGVRPSRFLPASFVISFAENINSFLA